MMFEPALIEPSIIEGAELGRQATQSPDHTELGGEKADHLPEPSFPGEFKPVLGFSLQLAQRIAGSEKIRDEVVTAICRKGEVAGFVCGIKGAPHQGPAGLDVLRPGHDNSPEGHALLPIAFE
jgi:hypothetical protein